MKRFRGQKIYLLARRYPSATERLVLTKKQNQTNKPKICKFIPILPFYSPFLYFSVLYIYIFIFLWTFETKITHLNKIYIFFSMNMKPRNKYISKLSDLSLSLSTLSILPSIPIGRTLCEQNNTTTNFSFWYENPAKKNLTNTHILYIRFIFSL